jgi:hypothetical protein
MSDHPSTNHTEQLKDWYERIPTPLRVGGAALAIVAMLAFAGWSTMGVGAKPTKSLMQETEQVLPTEPPNNVADTWVARTPGGAGPQAAMPQRAPGKTASGHAAKKRHASREQQRKARAARRAAPPANQAAAPQDIFFPFGTAEATHPAPRPGGPAAR